MLSVTLLVADCHEATDASWHKYTSAANKIISSCNIDSAVIRCQFLLDCVTRSGSECFDVARKDVGQL